MKQQIKAKKSKLGTFRSRGPGDKVFLIIVYILILAAVCVTLYPFIYVVSVAFSDGGAVSRGEVYFLPKGIDLTAFQMVMQYDQLWVSYRNTFFYTVFGTICNLIFSCLAAYPLSRRQFFLRRKLNFFLAFTMYFSGGMIPTYMIITGIGLYNSRLVMIIPYLVSAYNVMILRSAMESISEELFESGKLEGANDFTLMSRIAVPLCKPTLAVLGLYYAVARYNDFFTGMLYLSKQELQPLQMFLRRILIVASSEILQSAGVTSVAAAAQSTLKIRYVCIVLATLPILCICPFVQKYLVKGTMLGAVKG